MVNSLTKLGKWFFAVPFAAFGMMHLMKAGDLAAMVPAWMPGGIVMVYLTGAAQLAFVVSMIIGKYDKLGGMLTALMLLVFVLTIHMPGMSNPDPMMMQMAMSGMLKDLGLMGAALMYAGAYAKDSSVIG